MLHYLQVSLYKVSMSDLISCVTVILLWFIISQSTVPIIYIFFKHYFFRESCSACEDSLMSVALKERDSSDDITAPHWSSIQHSKLTSQSYQHNEEVMNQIKIWVVLNKRPTVSVCTSPYEFYLVKKRTWCQWCELQHVILLILLRHQTIKTLKHQREVTQEMM